MRLLLVRHGPTAWNAARRFQGHADEPLSAEGRRQALALRPRLSTFAVDAAYSSDRRRAFATARALVRDRGLEVRARRSLRELSFGLFEGLTFAEAEARYPEPCAAWLNDVVHRAPPEGESLAQLATRVEEFLDEVRALEPAGTVLVVSHEGTLRAIVARLLGLPPEASLLFRLDPASLTVVETHGDAAVLTLLNDTAHCPEPGGQR